MGMKMLFVSPIYAYIDEYIEIYNVESQWPLKGCTFTCLLEQKINADNT